MVLQIVKKINKVRGHSARYQRNKRLQRKTYLLRSVVRNRLKKAWEDESVERWMDLVFMYANKRFTDHRRTGRFCVFTGRRRNITWLRLSKYAIKRFTKAALIKDFIKQ